MINKRMKLGEMLLEAGRITPEQLQRALEEQGKTHRRLGEVLVELGIIDQNSLMDLLAEQLKIPRISLSPFMVQPGALETLPPDYCRKNLVCPLRMEGNRLQLCIADPMNIFLIDEIEHRIGRPVDIFLDSPAAIRAVLDYFQTPSAPAPAAQEAAAPPPPALAAAHAPAAPPPVPVAPVVHAALPSVPPPSPPPGDLFAITNQIVEFALSQRATAIHVEPTDGVARLRLRIDGVLGEPQALPVGISHPAGSLASEFKRWANLDITEKRAPQQGTITIAGRDVQLSVSTMPVARGETVVLKLTGGDQGRLGLAELGFSDHNLKSMEDLILRPGGLLLVAGPAGSGRTSTLYAALQKLADPARNICTVEDPVALTVPAFNQTPVRPDFGVTMGTGLRALLRQDPDVIMVGEVEDSTTAPLVVEAALRGHLVLAGIHARSATAAAGRLVELGAVPPAVAVALLGVVAQRLCRRLCASCRREQPVSKEILAFGQARFGRDLSDRKIMEAAGCPACRGSGFVGRCAIHEILETSEAFRAEVTGEVDPEKMAESAKQRGFMTLIEDGYLKVLQGITSQAEVYRVVR